MTAEHAPHAPLAPACVVCSRRWSQGHGNIPAIVPVQRALIHRHSSGAYWATCFCHGANCSVYLGLETPSDNKIRTTRAFAGMVAA